MERKELYVKIQELGLQEEVKRTFGKNYTMVGNAGLEYIVNNHTTTEENPEEVEEVEEVNTPTVNEVETPSAPVADNTTTEDAYEAACLVFLGVLKDSGKLDALLGKL